MFDSLFRAIEGVVDVATLPVRAAVGVVHSIEDDVRETFGIGPADRHYREAARLIEMQRRQRGQG